MAINGGMMKPEYGVECCIIDSLEVSVASDKNMDCVMRTFE